MRDLPIVSLAGSVMEGAVAREIRHRKSPYATAQNYTNHRKKWYFSAEGVLVYGKKEDRWLFASPSPDGFAFQAATQATTRLPPLVVLITRGMTTQPHAKRTSRIVSFLMVIGITRYKAEKLESSISLNTAHFDSL